MPYVNARGARLYYEEAGSGRPIVFVHEFAADLREWEPQMRWFSREYRCIAFNARGYPPSDVPDSPALYGYEHSADDILAVLDGLGIDKAHVVGLSMGAYATLQFGLRHPDRALSLVPAGIGAGAPYEHREIFRQQAEETADRLLEKGWKTVAEELALGSNRVQLLNKDPRGWETFKSHLAEHSAVGSAHTLRQYQAVRPSLYDYEKELAALRVPTLFVVGDEDEPCLDVNLYLKRTMPSAQLWVMPASGHAVNLEEPAAFNAGVHAFLSSVDRGCWRPRDPRAYGGGSLPTGKPA